MAIPGLEHKNLYPILLLGLLAAVGFIWWLWRSRRAGLTPFSDVPVEYADAKGWRIRYYRSGKGPYLVLLHGIGANLFCWRFILPYLTKHFTVIALDLPGFGQSSMHEGASYGLDDQTPRVTAFLDALKVDKAYVVGNSMGGNIALWMALLSPERILGCAVIAPATSRKLLRLPVSQLAFLSKPLSLLLTRRAMGWAHRRTVSKKDLVDINRVEETFRTYGGEDKAVRSFLLATEAIRDPRMPGVLAKLDIPVLILWGSRDKLVMRQVIDELESALGAAESHVHMGGGHHLQEDEPEWVSEKLLAFFLDKQD
jgi:pimeloyl-ACP methyl ester carboxylesterase